MKYFFTAVLFGFLFAGCNDDFTPKPRGFFRIDLPEHSYRSFDLKCGASMEVPKYAHIEMRDSVRTDTCWFNVTFPRLNAKLYFTYLPVGNNFETLVQESYGFAAKHEMKASGMKRTQFTDDENKLYGILYDIEGEAASQVQFFLTDSTNHFLRASLYFNHKPNPDSIAPVLAFLREDILHMAESVRWR